MTFLGKILIVLQVVFSLLLMAFAGAVFTVQSSWKEKAEKLTEDKESLDASLTELQEEFTQYKQNMNVELKNQTRDANNFQAQSDALQRQLADEKDRREQAETEKNSQKSIAESSGADANERRIEANIERKANRKLQTSLDDRSSQVRSLKDEVFKKDRSLEQLVAKHKGVLEDLAVLKRILAKNKLPSDPQEYKNLKDPPPDVEGVVLNTRKTKRNSPELIEVSIGSDDGLLKGHKLFIFRSQGKGKYLGVVRIVYLEPDRAVGTVVTKTKNGVIQRGDNVTTKL